VPRSPRLSGSRYSAEAHYRGVRRSVFQEVQGELSAAGIGIELRPIDAAALAAFETWQDRLVDWPWPQMIADWRRSWPERFELAIWSGDILCGLALGRPSPGPSHMSLHYMEGNPDETHPLIWKVTAVVTSALEAYAIALGKAELRMVDPFPEMVPFYCSRVMGFELVTPRRGVPYCRRSIEFEERTPP
jgi:hypothetical protein